MTAATASPGGPATSGLVRLDQALPLDSGRQLDQVELWYESWGQLSERRDNAVLVCHSLTKTAHARRGGPAEPPGWWEAAIGPGRMLDTDRFFVICTDTLAAGRSTRPASPDPASGLPYGSRFPVVTVRDMVRAQRGLLEQLGIERVHCVIGGCFGGQQALEWSITFPAQVARQVAIAVTPSTAAHSIAIFAVMRHLIRSDPKWNRGDYYGRCAPVDGLNRAVAAAMPLWMSRTAMEEKFGRRRASSEPRYSLDPEFEVETFIERLASQPRHEIDANGLMHLTRAVEYFDLPGSYGSLGAALAPVTAQTLLVSYSGDWRYPSDEMELIHQALTGAGVPSQHLMLTNPLGHGGFMYDPSDLAPTVQRFLSDEPVPATPLSSVR